MTAAGAILSARFAFPLVLGVGVDNRTTCELLRNGARVTPSAITYTLYDPAQVVVYTTSPTPAAVTELTVPAAELPTATATLGTGYLERWDCTVDGLHRVFDREAIVAKRSLFPVISDRDFDAYPGIKRGLQGQPGATSLQPWIDEAWKGILQDLAVQGKYASLVCTADAFRQHHIHRVLGDYFRWRHSETPDQGSYLSQAEFHEGRAATTWAGITTREDRNRDGFPDGDNRQGSGSILHFNASPIARTPRGPW